MAPLAKDYFEAHNNVMICKEIDRIKADILMRKLPSDNFYKAFHVERERKEANEQIWALPSGERIYYIVSIEEDDILLAGINNYLNLSSFAKVINEDKFRGMGRRCVKKLIEDVLVPRVKAEGRRVFYSNITSGDGKRVLDYLLSNLPDGISNINESSTGYSFCLC